MEITFVNTQNVGFLTLSDISLDDYYGLVNLINHIQNIDQHWIQINKSKDKENQLEIIYNFPNDDPTMIEGQFGYRSLSNADGQEDIIPGDDIHSVTFDVDQLSEIQLVE